MVSMTRLPCAGRWISMAARPCSTRWSVSAGAPSVNRRSPVSKVTRLTQPATSVTVPSGSPARKRWAPSASSNDPVTPGRKLVGEPLAVAGCRGRSHRPAVQVRVLEVKAGRPTALSFDGAGNVAHVLDVTAEAGRADERAVPTGQASFGDLFPAGVLEVASKEAGQPLGVEGAAHLGLGTG